MIFLLLVISLSVTTCHLSGKSKQVESLSTTLEKKDQDLKYFMTASKTLAARNDALVLSNRELSLMYPRIISEIKNMKVSPGKVEHYTETVVCQEKQILQKLKDSIIHDTVRVKAFDYHDTWYDVSGITSPDSAKIMIKSRDSIIQVVYRGERRHSWLWIFSPRKLQQVIRSANPNSKIEYSRTIEIVK